MIDSPAATVTFALALIVFSLGLLAWHWNTWRAADHGGLPERERAYFQRQFRRRTNASGGIGLVGLLLIAGLWIPQESIVNLLFLFGLLLIVGAVVILALLDLLATRSHYDRQSLMQAAQIAALQATLRRELAKQAEATGDSPPAP